MRSGVDNMQRSSEYSKALEVMKGPRPDEARALELLRRAHKKNDASATYAIATWYLFGRGGLRRNIRSAVKLLRQAARQKVPEAMYDLAVCYETGRGVNKNPKTALRYYLDAAIRGDGNAVFEVGRCFYYGIGVARNRDLADVWLVRAEELGVDGSNEFLSAPRSE